MDDGRAKITINIDGAVLEVVAQYAKANGLSKSVVIEAFLKSFITRSELFKYMEGQR